MSNPTYLEGPSVPVKQGFFFFFFRGLIYEYIKETHQ